MWKRITPVVVATVAVLLICGSSTFATSKDKEGKTGEKVRAGILKLGIGPSARVEVKLRDKTKLKGYIDQVAEDHFVVIDDSTGAATSVAYPQVKQVKGNNLSTGAKIAIGVGIALAVFLIIGMTAAQ